MSESRGVAIVTGSSRGVGAATAKLLAKEGFNVVVNFSKSEEEAKKIAAACEAFGPRPCSVRRMSPRTLIVAEWLRKRSRSGDALTPW